MARIGGREAEKIIFKTGNTLAESEIPCWLVDYNYIQTKKLQSKTPFLESAVKKNNIF